MMACGVFPVHGAKQKARVISIIQLRNITATMLGLKPFRVVWGPAFMQLCVVLLGEAFEVIVLCISPDRIFFFTW